MPFAYSLPCAPEQALDFIADTRLAAVGKGWTAGGDPTKQGRSIVHRAGWEAAKADPALRRKTPEGWTYHGHRLPLEDFRRKKVPESTEVTGLTGAKILVPLAAVAPEAMDFMTGGTLGFSDQWAEDAFRLYNERESFSQDGRDMFRLKATDGDLARFLFSALSATHELTAEALSDCRPAITTRDRIDLILAIWGFPVGKSPAAAGGG